MILVDIKEIKENSDWEYHYRSRNPSVGKKETEHMLAAAIENFLSKNDVVAFVKVK